MQGNGLVHTTHSLPRHIACSSHTHLQSNSCAYIDNVHCYATHGVNLAHVNSTTGWWPWVIQSCINHHQISSIQSYLQITKHSWSNHLAAPCMPSTNQQVPPKSKPIYHFCDSIYQNVQLFKQNCLLDSKKAQKLRLIK